MEHSSLKQASLFASNLSGLQEQLKGLEEQVTTRDDEIERLQEQLLQLTGDFKYNLKVLSSTDLAFRISAV